MKLIKENRMACRRTAVALALGFAVLLLPACSDGGGPPVESGGDDAGLTATLSEFEIAGNLVAEPGVVMIDVVNAGSIAHNLIVVGEARTSDIESGEREVLNVGTLTEGTYAVICDIPGHLEAGMETILVVGVVEND